jgi:ParB/RepB/Spo0J family partition protein
MVRVVKDGKGDVKYEIVFGLRRHGSCSLINNELKEAGDEFGFKFKAIVVDSLSDLDAYKLSKQENEFREDVSPWEHAMWLKEQRMEGGLYFGKSDSYIAEAEGLGRTTVNRFVNAAKLDEQWILMLGDPDKVNLKEAVLLANILDSREKLEIKEVFNKAVGQPRFESTKALREFVEDFFKVSRPVAIKRAGIEFSCKSGAKVVVRQKRGSVDEFKVEISKGDAELLDKLLVFLKGS